MSTGMTGSSSGVKWTVMMVGFGMLVPASVMGQSRCEFRDVVELSARAQGDVEIRAGSGLLEVEGSDAVSEVLVTATLCASEEDWLDELQVTAESMNSGVLIETEYPRDRDGWGNKYARIDLVVTVPSGMALDIEDSSGSMEVVNVGDVRIDDSSGEIIVRGAGAVVIDDSSGGIDIRDATGHVEVSDGSGGLEIRSVDGDVLLSDGSGGIDVEAVTGSVRIERMGSGGVRIDDVEGDLIVEEGKRSRIKYSDVRGTLDLPPARRRGN
ncbi:MAG: hypothetical protein ACR2QM_10725 [Longimicrobiales bacterium]